MRLCAAPECQQPGSRRCSRCKQAWYCSPQCQRRAWPAHKSACIALALSVSSAAAAKPFEKALDAPTRGAAGWTHFVIDGQDYVASRVELKAAWVTE